LDHGGDVGKDGRRGTGEPTGRWRRDRATPSSLVEAEGLDPARGERGEQGVVGVDVIGETMYEDEDGRWGKVRRLSRLSIRHTIAGNLIVANGLARFLCTVWYRLVAHALLPLLDPYVRLPIYPLWITSFSVASALRPNAYSALTLYHILAPNPVR